MGMVMKLQRHAGFLWEYLNGREIKQKL